MKEQELKATRVTIDGLFKSINLLPKTRETSLAYTTCQLAKMWIGKALGKLEVEYPYKESKDASTGNYIAPTADTNNTYGLLGNGTIEQIKNLRAFVEKLYTEVEDKHIKDSSPENIAIRFEMTNCYKYLNEVSMWLGMELGRIRDNQTEGDIR